MFNKVFTLALLAMTLSPAVDDFSSERLLGIEVGYTTTAANAGGANNSSRDIESGLRIGAQNDEWRTTLTVNFLEANGRDYQKVMLNFDRFVWASLYKTDNIVFKPFLGGHVGWLHYTEASDLSDNGLAYGAQMGLALNVLNQVDFDLSYRYTVTDIESVDHIGSVVFGVNYIY